ncbi:MAG: hypothetical protein ABL956_10335 [Hyphomonadaceae bacterium]
MSAFDRFVLAIAGANGGVFYFALRRRERLRLDQGPQSLGK